MEIFAQGSLNQIVRFAGFVFYFLIKNITFLLLNVKYYDRNFSHANFILCDKYSTLKKTLKYSSDQM